MNPKYKTLEWWAMPIWFIVFGVWMLIVVLEKHLIPINLWILVAGIGLMIVCAGFEDEWFPPEPKGEA